MKKLYFLSLIFTTALADAAIPDSIPNAGFEQWLIFSWFDFPAGWVTSNTQLLAPSVRKDTIANSGNYAMRLTHTNPAWAQCSFHLNAHPTNLGGYVKNLLINGGSGEISVQIYSNNFLVDSGHMVLYGGINPNYSSFIVPISQNIPYADSCVITLTGGTVDFSDLIYDDLEFDFSLGIETMSAALVYPPFPNPCTNDIYVDTRNLDFSPTTIDAYNTAGQHVVLDIIKSPFPVDPLFLPQRMLISLRSESLTKGYWNIIMRNEEKSISFTIIKL